MNGPDTEAVIAEDIIALSDAEDYDAAADEEVLESGLILAGASSEEEEDISLDGVPNKPLQDLSLLEQKQLADRIVAEIDDHEDGIPMLPLNLTQFAVWSFENCMIPPDIEGDKPQPAIIITFATADNPRGTPFILVRDRALKFASQLKKRANQGPSLQQRAAQAGLSVPPDAGEKKLIVPG